MRVLFQNATPVDLIAVAPQNAMLTARVWQGHRLPERMTTFRSSNGRHAMSASNSREAARGYGGHIAIGPQRGVDLLPAADGAVPAVVLWALHGQM